ncbi:MAG: isochorismatase family protein [Kluyvera sp.]
MLHKNSPHFLPVVGFEAQADEKVFTKRTSSAFSSTDLYTWLEHKKIVDVAVIGAVAGYCVNSTIRMGSDLGLAMTIVRDAVLSFPLEEAGISAAEVFNVTLGLLEGEFAQSVNVADLTFNPR